MANNGADTSVRVNGDIGPLRRAMRDGARELFGFQGRVEVTAQSVVRAGKYMIASFAAVAAGALAAANKAAEMGKEINNLSRIAGVGTTEFQKMAAAARTVGIEQDKLADIFRDTNDKLGDYLNNGAGPLVDFFDNIAPKVGVTADAFRDLSGPEALQLYFDTLERSGASHGDLTFWMESLASDATDLIPLLRANGAELKRLGDEAERSGRIISASSVQALVEMDSELQKMTATLRTQAIEVIVEYKDEILAVAEFITGTLIPALGGMARKVTEVAETLAPAIRALSDFSEKAGPVIEALKFIGDYNPTNPLSALNAMGAVQDQVEGQGGGAPLTEEEIRRRLAAAAPSGPPRGATLIPAEETLTPAEAAAAAALGGGTYGGRGMASGTTSDQATQAYVDEMNRQREAAEKAAEDAAGGSSGGGGGRGLMVPTQDDLAAFEEQFMSERELLQKNLDDQLTIVQSFRDAKLQSEEEMNELEAKVRAEHLERMEELEKRSNSSRLNKVKGIFGEVASLMNSEGKKQFQVGKVAAISEAGISGALAVQQAYQKGVAIGGPPVGAIFAGVAGIKSASILQKIKQTQYGGGGGGNASAGGGGGGGAPGAGGGAAAGPMSVTNLRINTVGGDMIRLGDAEKLFGAINQGLQQGLRLNVERV